MATRGETIIGLAAMAGIAVSAFVIEDPVLAMRVAGVALAAGGDAIYRVSCVSAKC
jgi:hypothetical protein